MKNLLLLGIALILAGCASSPYQYYGEKPTQVTGKYMFKLGETTLTLNTERQPAGYLNQNQLEGVLEEKLIAHLEENEMYSESSNLTANVIVNYQRKFGYGDSLAKPKFSFTVDVFDGERKVGSTATGLVTTSFGTFGNAAVNAQIGTGTWDEENEPEDIDMIALSISQDLAEF
ncbi:conserved hypothetical protein [Oleispira antarctica RB-8]|uniref:Lipoprotein n=1 Tax=Oleispira antarctica RB-8 TaxID=698738 RepID=R4YSS3_OLEAN|nr:conserved hypothetical protein [Oleispira antarctica RB-8]